MTKTACTARSHIRNAVLCALVTFGLAACGADDVSGGSAATGAVVTPNTGMIDRLPGTTANTPPNTATVATNGQGSASSGTTAPTNKVSTGTATLDWTPPIQNSDGSALTNLAGYTVYYGTSPDSLTESVKVSNPGLSAYTLSNLSSGTWYFSVTAYSLTGIESSRSGVISTTI